MSILIKGSARGSSANSGYPTNNVKVTSVCPSNNSVLIKYVDPENTVIESKILSEWKGTLLIRNEDHYPKSIKDGVTVLNSTNKNQYKNVSFADSGVINGKKYYYRFFTYNGKSYNTDSESMFTCIPNSFDSVLENNSWERISQASEAGIASQLWNIGDTKKMYYESNYSPYSVKIWDFDHYDKADGTGKAGIVFGSQKIEMKSYMNSSRGNIGGWKSSNLRRNLNFNFGYISDSDDNYTIIGKPTVWSKDIVNVVKPVVISAYKGGEVDHSNIGNSYLTMVDIAFVPSFAEMSGNGIINKSYDTYNTYKNIDGPFKKFPAFTNDKSRIFDVGKNFSGYRSYYWTRTGASYDDGFFTIDAAEGDFLLFNGSGNYADSDYIGAVYCFCV